MTLPYIDKALRLFILNMKLTCPVGDLACAGHSSVFDQEQLKAVYHLECY